MKKLIPLFLLLGVFTTGAQSFAPSWFTNGTYFPTNYASTHFAAGTNVIFVITADVNNDARPDLIGLTGSANPNFIGGLTVFTNDGSGVLNSNAAYAVSNATSVAAGDINGDGYVDLICTITNGTVDAGWLLVLTNNGAGGFAEAFTNTVGHNPSSVVAADVNRDGRTDLACANASDATLTVLTNGGGGIFVPAATNSVGSGARGLVAKDINGDSFVDLVCANPSGNTLSVLTNNGAGKFTSTGSPQNTINQPYSVAVADVNGDGRLDLISADLGSASQGWLTVFTNSGSGKFGLFATLGQLQSTGTSWPYWITAVTNFDGHGQLAFVVANYGAINGGSFTGTTLTVLTNSMTTNGFLGYNATLDVGRVPECIAVADFNGDGRPDLASANAGTNTLTVLFNMTATYKATFTVGSYGSLSLFANGSPAPTLYTTNKTLPGGLNFFSVPPKAGTTTLTDVGAAVLSGTPAIGSGGTYNLLLVASNVVNSSLKASTQMVSLVINQRPIFQGAALSSNSALSLNFSAWYYTTGDINGDGALDVVFGNGDANSLIVLTNNGYGVFGSNSAINVTLPTSPSVRPLQPVVADINNDGNVDVISFNGVTMVPSLRSLTILTNNGSGVFGSNATISLSAAGTWGNGNLAAADINGDGKVDLIASNPERRNLTVFTNNGSGRFSSNATYAVPLVGPSSVMAADLDGNGRVDLVSATYNSGFVMVTVLTNNIDTNGVFGLKTNLVAGSFPAVVAMADVDGNGNLALIYGKVPGGNNFKASVVVQTNNGTGAFGARSTNSISGDAPLGVKITAADVNNDGKVDLVCHAVNTISSPDITSVLTNNGAGGFALDTSFNLGSSIGDIMAADLNGDGRVDLMYPGSFSPVKLTVLTNAAPLIRPTLTESGTNTFTMAASGFPQPYFTASGVLPPGVTFTTNGVFTGSPSAGSTGTYSVVVTATNVFGFASQNVDLVVRPSVALVTNAFSTAQDTPLALTTNDALGASTDLNGFLPLRVTDVSAFSISGGTVVPDNGLYIYTPPNGFTGLDAFTYNAANTNGNIAQGTVLIVVVPPGNPSLNTIVTSTDGDQLGFQFTGIPGQRYYYQWATNVVGPYVDLLPGIVADGNGLVPTAITNLSTTPNVFYRVRNAP